MIAARRLAPLAAVFVALAAGCDRDPETAYGMLRGESLNGVSAFVQLLRDAGHRTATRRRLAERMAGRHDAAIVFAHGFGGLDQNARHLLERFLAAEGDQTLVLVLRDSDAAIDYWHSIAMAPGLPAEKAAAARANHRAAVVELRFETSTAVTADPTDRSPLAYGQATRKRPVPPPTEVDLAGDPTPSIAARWELRRRLEPPRGTTPLWTRAGEPLLVHSRGSDRALVLASAAPLLNGGLVDPGNRRLAAALVAELPEDASVVVVGSTRVGTEVEETEPRPSVWRLVAVPPHPWIFGQAIVAMVLFCWWKAPIFGRPRRESESRPEDFGHHVTALGSLLRRSRDRAFAEGRLAAWQRGGAGVSAIPTAAARQTPTQRPRRQR